MTSRQFEFKLRTTQVAGSVAILLWPESGDLTHGSNKFAEAVSIPRAIGCATLTNTQAQHTLEFSGNPADGAPLGHELIQTRSKGSAAQ